MLNHSHVNAATGLLRGILTFSFAYGLFLMLGCSASETKFDSAHMSHIVVVDILVSTRHNSCMRTFGIRLVNIWDFVLLSYEYSILWHKHPLLVTHSCHSS